MNIIDKNVGEIVATDFRSASVFKKYKIDFCCGGGKSIDAVCKAKGIDKDTLIADLNKALNNDSLQHIDFDKWGLNKLIDHILEHHHAYTRRTLDELIQYLDKVAKVHGNGNPELLEINTTFELLSEELLFHMQKEEMILFPFIRKIENAKTEDTLLEEPPFGTISNPIRMMESEHDQAGDLMSQLRTLSSDFTPPDYACNTYKTAYKLLEALETDLHTHIHLENNILFPKAVQLEQELLNN